MLDAREHVLATTLQLFLRNSYRDVTMSELVKASGLSKGAFYHYFDSKEQLFAEVINHYYASLLRDDFSQYSHESLAAFYCDYLADAAQRLNHHAAELGGDHVLRANHYLLLFDALKRLPTFQALREHHKALELAEWSAVVQQARTTGEITTTLSDAQVAKLFIYLADGIAVNFVLHSQTDELQHEVIAGFNALYQQLKA